jgi:hypothetical protein
MSWRVEALCDGIWYNPHQGLVDPCRPLEAQNVHSTLEAAEAYMEVLRFSSQEWERTPLRVVPIEANDYQLSRFTEDV